MQAVYWCSLDPINCVINFYPKIIAERLEKDYCMGNEKTDLGADFFDATVHYDKNILYQTTMGSYGHRGYNKQPGYRCVKRVEITNYIETDTINYTHYNIYKSRAGWRFTDDPSVYEKTLTGEIPHDVIIHPSIHPNNVDKKISYWNQDMLNDDNVDKTQNIVVWQWCKKTNSNTESLYNLSDDSWIPYLYEQNNIIEDAFANNNSKVEIILPFDNSRRTISFSRGSCYASQIYRCWPESKYRIVRRKIITLQTLIDHFNKINNNNYNSDNNSHEIIDELYNSTTIPSEFYCPITQSIMTEPVKTCDGHVYDKSAIEKWFEYKNTSPLTNLHLDNTNLLPYYALCNTINKFKSDKPELFK